MFLLLYLNATNSIVTPSVQLSCDMAGHVPPASDLQWFNNSITDAIQRGIKYSILYLNGTRIAQSPGYSNIGPSILTIKNPRIQDSREYQCK